MNRGRYVSRYKYLHFKLYYDYSFITVSLDPLDARLSCF